MAVWKPVPGFEGWYEASRCGLVRSVDRTIAVTAAGKRPYSIFCRGKVLNPTSSHGYPSVTLWMQHSARIMKVGAIVCRTFVGPRPAGYYVCHRDGNPENSALSNLYYGTPKQNSDDARRHGTARRGSRIPWSKLTEDDVLYIRANPDALTQSALARRFGTQQSQISRIRHRHQWRHVA